MNQKAKELLEKYKNGTCTLEERQLIDSYFDKYVLESKEWPSSTSLEMLSKQMDQHLHHQRRDEHVAKNRTLFYKTAAAAVLLVGFSFMAYWFFPTTSSLLSTDHKPGEDKATLTLADGTQIELDKIGPDTKGLEIGGLRIEKEKDGQISFQIEKTQRSEPSEDDFHVISTPKGGSYRLKLPDGSQVWLNASSSLSIPTSFNERDRKVTFEGEGYFQVAHQSNKPFFVDSKGQTIRVLGTEFNVSTYADDQTLKTTLITGKLAVDSKNQGSQLLLPGEQAILSKDGFKVFSADTELVMAWKNGVFMLKNTPLIDIMKDISRWYNVEIDLHELPADHFSAIIPRDYTLRQVLNMLEGTSNLKFTIEGRRVRMDK